MTYKVFKLVFMKKSQMAEKISNKHHNFMTTTMFETLPFLITEHGVDTLMISKLLRQFNFSEEQADIMSEMAKQTNSNIEKIVSKKISDHKEEVLRDTQELKTKSDLLVTKKELELQIEKVRAEIEIVRVEIEKVRAETEVVRAELKTDISNIKSDLIKWVAGLMIANTGLLFILIKFFNYTKIKPS